MIKKISLFFFGYLLIIFVVSYINGLDETKPSIFGDWMKIITPVYIVVFIIVQKLYKKYGKAE